MAFDLATAKTRLGITGTTQDVEIQAALDASLELIERYCDRKFLYATETARFYYFRGDHIFLPHYPVESVSAITIDTMAYTGKYKVHRAFGMIQFAGRIGYDEIDVTYSGGYRVLPPDLELVLWSVFGNVWPNYSGGTATVAAGAIESITIADVGTVRYSTGAASSGSTGGGYGWRGILGPYINVLDLYRRDVC